MTVLLFDEEVTKAAIDLAADDVTTEEAAAELFANLRHRVLEQPGIRIGRAQMARPTFITNDWWVAQQQVRRLLPKIEKFDTLTVSQRAELLSAVNEGLILEGQVTPQATKQGVAIRIQSGSMVGAVSLGLLPFVVPNGWPTIRIGKCRLKECGKYFLRPDGQRGRKRVFCEPKHAGITHVREFRERVTKSVRAAAKHK